MVSTNPNASSTISSSQKWAVHTFIRPIKTSVDTKYKVNNRHCDWGICRDRHHRTIHFHDDVEQRKKETYFESIRFRNSNRQSIGPSVVRSDVNMRIEGKVRYPWG